MRAFRPLTSLFQPYRHHPPGTPHEDRVVTRRLLGFADRDGVVGVPIGTTVTVAGDIGPDGFVPILCGGHGKHVYVHAADLLDGTKLCDASELRALSAL